MKTSTLKKAILAASGLALLLLGTSCVPLALGAAGGYAASEQGYGVQSPITKE